MYGQIHKHTNIWAFCVCLYKWMHVSISLSVCICVCVMSLYRCAIVPGSQAVWRGGSAWMCVCVFVCMEQVCLAALRSLLPICAPVCVPPAPTLCQQHHTTAWRPRRKGCGETDRTNKRQIRERRCNKRSEGSLYKAGRIGKGAIEGVPAAVECYCYILLINRGKVGVVGGT